MPENLKTLVADDEERIRFFLTETLERVGHRVTAVGSGDEALDRLQDSSFDVAILDLKLGGTVDGQRILEAIRWRWPSTVVIMLTAHGSLESAMEAIDEGVDGYLLKPVRPAEVRQAIEEAFYRRRKRQEARQTEEEEGQILERGPFRVDLQRHEASFREQSLGLSAREFDLLVYLMRRAPEVVGPKELVEVVREYEPDHTGEAREIIKWYVYRLRKKVEPNPSEPRYIVNVRGVGYRFAA